MPTIVIDFETEAIQSRPEYPPTPVGVSILENGVAKYYSWGHPTGNNCTLRDAMRALSRIWSSRKPLVFHNAAFDLAVAYEKLGLPELAWDRVHDTLFLAFLDNPHAMKLDLKSLADAYCGMAPTERDELKDWIIANVPEARRAKKQWGAHIAKASGDLVGRYADGDTKRTLALFEVLYPRIQQAGMQRAYDRERKLLPILMRNTREGIPVDVAALRADVQKYRDVITTLDAWILTRLGLPADTPKEVFNIDSDEQLADKLDEAGLADGWELTAKGNRSTSGDALNKHLTDRELYAALQYRGPLITCVHTFMENWLATAEASGGLVFVSWNQTRGPNVGARTGRLSSTPNFQNIPTDLEGVNAARPPWCPELPKVRKYIIAPEGYVILDRDFNSQELRVFAHYEDDKLAAQYAENAEADLHQFVSDMITAMGTPVTRKMAKTLNFLTIYGGGVGKLAMQLGVDVATATRIKVAYVQLLPALKELNAAMRRRARDGQPITTWGGRVYYVEPPKTVNGQLRQFDYKLLNVLIQGSSADITKDAIIAYDATRGESRLLLNVHDQIVLLCKVGHEQEEMRKLKAVMNGIQLDVPMLSSGEWGTNWQELTDFEEIESV